MRVRKIIVWPAVNTSSSATVSVEFQDGKGYDKDSEKSSTVPLGTLTTGPCIAVPPKNTLCSSWIDNSLSQTACIIKCPTGSVVDVHISHYLSNNEVPWAMAVTATAAGTFFYPVLSGTIAAGLVPVDRPTSE
jgi:hypothetical protein